MIRTIKLTKTIILIIILIGTIILHIIIIIIMISLCLRVKNIWRLIDDIVHF